MKNVEKLNDIFNVEPVDEKLPTIIPVENLEQDQQDDYDLARQTLRRVILKGEGTLDDMLELAKNSEHPRTYEVAGQLMKTMSDLSKDLIGLQKTVKDLKPKTNPDKVNNTQNNIVFAGSTQDLLKMLSNNEPK
jgi:hypothetical protein